MPFAQLLAGLRARLILLVLAAILPASILLLVSSLEQRQSVVDKQREGALANARLLAAMQGNMIESTGQLLEWIAQFPEVQSSDAEACNRRLEHLLASSRGIRGFLVANPQGDVICVAPLNAAKPLINIAQIPAFSRAVEEQSFVIGSVTTGTLSGAPNLTFGLPVMDERGQLVLVITAGLDVDNIHETLRNMHLPNNGTLAVMDADGVLLGYAGGRGEDGGVITPEISPLILAGSAGITETVGEDGVSRLLAFAPYLLNGRPALYALVSYPAATLYAEADMQMRRNLVVLALFAALTMLAAWLAGDIMIVRRARSVIWAASRLRHGDLSARAGGPYGSGELSTLARDFDAMAGQLQQRQRERDQAMRELASSMDRYQKLVSAVSSIVWTSDREGQLHEPMPAWEAFTGQRWPAYSRGGGFEGVHPDDRQRLTAHWMEAVHNGTPLSTEYRLWHAPSNQYRHVVMRGMPMLDDNGQVIEWIGIISDIHERKQAEQDRQLLLDVSDAMSQARDESEALTALAGLLAPARADWCTIAVVTSDGRLQRVAQSHADALAAAEMQRVSGNHDSVPLPPALETMACMRTGQVQRIDHVTPELLQRMHTSLPHARQLDALQQQGLQQLMFAPILLQGKPAGLIALGITQPKRSFDASMDALMTEVARRTELTLENQRLYLEERESRLRAERNAGYLSRLQSVSSELAMLTAPSIQNASESILDMLMRAFGATTGAISIVSEDARWLKLVCARGYTPEVTATFDDVPIEEFRTAATEVVRTGEAVYVSDQQAYLQRYPQVARIFKRFNDHACAVAPMKVNNRVAGVIALNFDQARDFNTEDKDLLMTLCMQGAQVMMRTKLFEEERLSRTRAERSANYLSRLQMVSTAMASTPALSLKQLTDAMLDAMMQSFGANTGAISVFSTDRRDLELISVRGYTDSEIAGFHRVQVEGGVTASAEVAATGEPVWICDNDAYLQRYPRSPEVYQRGDDHACAVVPMKLQQRVVGVISLNFDHDRDFSLEDKDLLMTLCAQCAQAMERAQLYEQAQQMNQQLEARVQARTRQLETTITQLRKSREQLRELSGQLLAAVEEERKRISREVHDELGQALTVIKMDLGFARGKLKGTAPDAASHLEDSVKHIDETIRIMRRIATDLRPEILDSLGLEAAVEWQAQEFESRTGIRCSVLKQSSDKPIFDKDVSIAAYRIVQEALTNVARHAHATEAHITYVADDERLFIEVQDNGVGIPDAPEHGRKSLGLRGMRERARYVHGTVSVEGGPGRGTTVTLEVALKPAAGETSEVA
jgi:PAS domain S-box-containing protein